MVEHRDGSLAAFYDRFRRSPVRWVVLVHAVLLGTLISILTALPNQDVLWLLDASLVTAQVALLLIWLTSDGNRPSGVRRMLGVTSVLVTIHVVHAPAVRDPEWIPSFVCMVPCVFLMLSVVALPLTIAELRGFLVARFSRERMPPPRRFQFSIRSAMVGALCVAVLFGLKGLVTAVDRSPESIGMGMAGGLAIVAMCLVASAIYLSIPLVAAWAVLTPGRILPRLVTAVVGWGMGVLLVFHYTQAGEGSFQVNVSASVTAGAIPILLATLFVLRQMGYRAVWVDRDGWLLLDDPKPRSPFGPRSR